MLFRDRNEAGRQLAQALSDYKNRKCTVYALPRGGVVIGAAVAQYLKAPLRLLIARKIGHPDWPEYAIGAVTAEGEPVWNEQEARTMNETWLQRAVDEQRQEAKRRHQQYIGEEPPVPQPDETAIVVDDGIATGLTMIAAIAELRASKPQEIIAAVPVAPEEAVAAVKNVADTLVALHIAPSGTFAAVGNFYQDFAQVEDAEVRQIMAKLSAPENANP